MKIKYLNHWREHAKQRIQVCSFWKDYRLMQFYAMLASKPGSGGELEDRELK